MASAIPRPRVAGTTGYKFPLTTDTDISGAPLYGGGVAPGVMAPGVTAPGAPVAGSPLGVANATNSQNLDFVRGGQQTDPTYGMISNLLNPNWGPTVYDTGEASAEDALNRGISGSNLANFRGARMYTDQLTKNAEVANNLLTGATNRLPTPFNPDRFITSSMDQQKLNLEQQQLAQQAALAREAQIAETNRAQIAAASRYGGGGGAGHGAAVHGGGGGAGVQGGWDSSPMPTMRTGGGSTPYNGGGWNNGMWTGGGAVGAPSGNQVQFDWGSGDTSTGSTGGEDWWNQDLFGAGGGQGSFDNGFDYSTPDYGGGGGEDYSYYD